MKNAPQHAINEMNASLRRKYETIRELFSGNTADTVRVRHQIGGMISEIRNAPDKYGARGVILLATALGRDETTLYRYGQVATRWTGDELGVLLKRVNIFGEPISWSHLVELTAVNSKRDRAALVERVLGEGLSVRELARVISSSSTDTARDQTRPLAVDLSEMVSASERYERRASRWSEVLLTRVEEAIADGVDLAPLLDKAEAAQARLLESCHKNLDRLRDARARFSATPPRKNDELPEQTSTVRGRDRAAPRRRRSKATKVPLLAGGRR